MNFSHPVTFPLKTKLIASLLCALSAAAANAQSKLYVEAGVSYFDLQGATFADNTASNVAVVGVDDSAWAPIVAAGYSFTEHIGLRFSYQYVSDIRSAVDRTYPAGEDSYVVNSLYSDDLHILALAPEFKWILTPKLSFSLSPELNWIAMREDMRSHTDAPSITVIPQTSRTEEEFTFGASAGVSWALDERSALTLAYKYVDLKPSWDRTANVVSAGLRWKF
jgi:opacity protein-like surface antigen